MIIVTSNDEHWRKVLGCVGPSTCPGSRGLRHSLAGRAMPSHAEPLGSLGFSAWSIWIVSLVNFSHPNCIWIGGFCWLRLLNIIEIPLLWARSWQYSKCRWFVDLGMITRISSGINPTLASSMRINHLLLLNAFDVYSLASLLANHLVFSCWPF